MSSRQFSCKEAQRTEVPQLVHTLRHSYPFPRLWLTNHYYPSVTSIVIFCHDILNSVLHNLFFSLKRTEENQDQSSQEVQKASNDYKNCNSSPLLDMELFVDPFVVCDTIATHQLNSPPMDGSRCFSFLSRWFKKRRKSIDFHCPSVSVKGKLAHLKNQNNNEYNAQYNRQSSLQSCPPELGSGERRPSILITPDQKAARRETHPHLFKKKVSFGDVLYQREYDVDGANGYCDHYHHEEDMEGASSPGTKDRRIQLSPQKPHLEEEEEDCHDEDDYFEEDHDCGLNHLSDNKDKKSSSKQDLSTTTNSSNNMQSPITDDDSVTSNIASLTSCSCKQKDQEPAPDINRQSV